ELARIVTAPTGTVTIGDSTQTGDITFSGATVATTAGAATTVVQSTTGAGQIVLDDSNGTALDGNGGSISLTAGTGGIAALNPANTTAEIATTGAGVTLNTTGPIGAAGYPIQFADNSNTAQQVVAVGGASAAYLDGLGNLTLGSVAGSTANTALTVTARTNLVVADNATINTGTATLSLGADLQADGSGDDGGVGTLSVDAGANLYGASITLRGAEVNIASTANVGSATSQSPVSTFVPSNAGLDGPYCMSFDASGNLYVANAENNTISKVTPAGTVSTFVSSGLSYPSGLAFDSSGNLYVTNQVDDTISKVTPGGTVSTFVSSGLSGPIGLAFDSSGNLYVANYSGNTISKVTPGGTVSTFVSSGLSGPGGLAFDASGNLYIVNGGANTISKVTPAGVVTTLVSGLNGPADLAFDSGGALYITNFNGNTISKVTAIPATTQVTIQSSLPSRPMSLGGSNDAAVDGINLTSAELARIVTAPTGTVTIGDPTQTGDITFSGATVATTAGAATDVVQSPTGDGQVVLDDSNGTALDGNGGSISLTAGTGGIAALNPANTTAEIATTGAGVTLNTTGPIGTASNPIQFADNTNTAQQVVAVGAASTAYLDGLGSLTLGSVTGGTANTALTVTARTNLVVAA